MFQGSLKTLKAPKTLKALALAATLAATLATGFTAGGAMAETRFLKDIEDMPLAPGLAEVEGEGIVFDKPEGRIVRALARGDVPAAAVRGFYVKTLPALGWAGVGAGTGTGTGAGVLSYARERERLEITIESPGPGAGKGDGPVTVRFALQPE